MSDIEVIDEQGLQAIRELQKTAIQLAAANANPQSRSREDIIRGMQGLVDKYPGVGVESGVTEAQNTNGGFLDFLKNQKRIYWDQPFEGLGTWQKLQAKKWKRYIDELNAIKNGE